MKNFITMLLLLVGITSLFAQSTKKITTYYDYGNTQIKERYYVETTNMQKHGEYKEWSKDGRVAIVCRFSNGELHGKLTSYVNKLGFCIDHKIIKIENYNHGKKHGLQTYYLCYGVDYKGLEKTLKYNNGVITEETYYFSNGKKQKHAPMNGLYQQWYESGVKQGECLLKDGIENGMLTGWHENGKIYLKGNMVNGVKDGKWTEWDENGEVISEDNYIDGVSGNAIAEREAKLKAEREAKAKADSLAAIKAEAKAKAKHISDSILIYKNDMYRIELNKFNKLDKIAKAKHLEVENLFLIPSENGRWTVPGKEGKYKIKKKNLYDAYIIYYNETKDMMVGQEYEDDMWAKISVAESIIYLCDKVIGFFNSNSKDMEKQLKNQTNPDQIGKIFGYGK
jgi:antitoxin component YwqK of YwqJK toxin-antitoxin module